MILLKSDRELAHMRKVGQVVAETILKVTKAVSPGITTAELDALAEDYLFRKGARPAFKGFEGYPKAICTSVNNEVVHGIPSLRKLEDGNIISIDIGAEINGYYGDAALTLPVGHVSQEIQRLLEITRQALKDGLAQAVEGNRLSDISHTIQVYVESRGFSVVREFVGHGIGRSLHEEPQIPNYGSRGHGPRLRRGMTLAIEPMVNMGTPDVKVLDNGWTVITSDGKLSAHFEHTVAITAFGAEILTAL